MDHETWKYFRKDAMKLAGKCDRAFRSSQIAYERGDGSKAKSDSNLGKYYRQQCDEANKSAANAIFIYMNDKRPLNEIDLHGLYVNEAMEKLETRVIYGTNKGMKWLDVIVGKGNHSEDGPKIKPRVEQFAKDNCIRYTLYVDNPGCIRFNFGQYDDVESSDDEESSFEIIARAHQYQQKINVPRRTVTTFEPQYLQNRQTFESESSDYSFKWIVAVLLFVGLLKLFRFF